MNCLPIDDYCKLHHEYLEVISESKSEKETEIGIFNGKRYSFLMVEGTPVIAIEAGEKTTFLMGR